MWIGQQSTALLPEAGTYCNCLLQTVMILLLYSATSRPVSNSGVSLLAFESQKPHKTVHECLVEIHI